MADPIMVLDCDGHIIESIPEMVPYLDPIDREVALNPSRNRQGVFASLDDIHYPRNVRKSGEVETPRRPRVDASDHRKGSGEDWVAFLEKGGVSQAVLFPSEGLSVGFFQQADYAARVCRAFNDYVSERYRKIDNRLHPMGLIAMQDVKSAVKELRRLVLDLKLPGAMLPSRGLPLHLGHDYYWPVARRSRESELHVGIHGAPASGSAPIPSRTPGRRACCVIPCHWLWSLSLWSITTCSITTAIYASAFLRVAALGCCCSKTAWTATITSIPRALGTHAA
jgi:predicted TIM-barrel fold metal-dependent hydrolase